MRRILIEGGQTLLPVHGVQSASVLVEDGLIVATEDAGGARPDLVLHARGLLVLPGLVDLHGDWFELLVQPRPGVGFPLDLALAQADRQFLLNGVTTAYLAQGCSWEGGLRGVPAATALVTWLAANRARIGCDMRVHLRHEVFHVDAVPIVENWLASGGIQMLVLNEHLAEYEARIDNPSKLAFWAAKSGHDTTSFIAAIRAARSREAEVGPTLARLCAAARAAGVPIGSHDDPDPATRAAFSTLGANIAEFPLTRATAAAARAAGEPVILGAPNVLRGGSSAGNASASDIIADGNCDALCSDYYIPSMLAAPFRLVRDGVVPLSAAWDLVSGGPARAVGLDDRGAIAAGRRADLLLVDATEPAAPRVLAAIGAGRLLHAEAQVLA